MSIVFQQSNFSKGMQGKEGQFVNGDRESFRDAENFLTDSSGSLFSRPGIRQVHGSIESYEKVTSFSFRGERFLFIYDSLYKSKLQRLEGAESGSTYPLLSSFSEQQASTDFNEFNHGGGSVFDRIPNIEDIHNRLGSSSAYDTYFQYLLQTRFFVARTDSASTLGSGPTLNYDFWDNPDPIDLEDMYNDGVIVGGRFDRIMSQITHNLYESSIGWSKGAIVRESDGALFSSAILRPWTIDSDTGEEVLPVGRGTTRFNMLSQANYNVSELTAEHRKAFFGVTKYRYEVAVGADSLIFYNSEGILPPLYYKFDLIDRRTLSDPREVTTLPAIFDMRCLYNRTDTFERDGALGTSTIFPEYIDRPSINALTSSPGKSPIEQSPYISVIEKQETNFTGVTANPKWYTDPDSLGEDVVAQGDDMLFGINRGASSLFEGNRLMYQIKEGVDPNEVYGIIYVGATKDRRNQETIPGFTRSAYSTFLPPNNFRTFLSFSDINSNSQRNFIEYATSQDALEPITSFGEVLSSVLTSFHSGEHFKGATFVQGRHVLLSNGIDGESTLVSNNVTLSNQERRYDTLRRFISPFADADADDQVARALFGYEDVFTSEGGIVLNWIDRVRDDLVIGANLGTVEFSGALTPGALASASLRRGIILPIRPTDALNFLYFADVNRRKIYTLEFSRELQRDTINPSGDSIYTDYTYINPIEKISASAGENFVIVKLENINNTLFYGAILPDGKLAFTRLSFRDREIVQDFDVHREVLVVTLESGVYTCDLKEFELPLEDTAHNTFSPVSPSVIAVKGEKEKVLEAPDRRPVTNGILIGSFSGGVDVRSDSYETTQELPPKVNQITKVNFNDVSRDGIFDSYVFNFRGRRNKIVGLEYGVGQ